MARPSYAYLWGLGSSGALGLGRGNGPNEDPDEDDDDDSYFNSPFESERPVLLRSPLLDGLQLQEVVCSKEHTLFLTECGHVLGTGSGLGALLEDAGQSEVLLRPRQVVRPLQPLAPFGLHQGLSSTHHLMLCRHRQEGHVDDTTTHVYGWGHNNQGQLFMSGRSHVSKPTLVESLEGLDVVQLALGDHHSLALTGIGQVWSSGKNGDGQLGLGGEVGQRPPGPHLVAGLDGVRVVQVACGTAHSVALSNDGRVYTWGNGLSGQLGHGDDLSASQPCLVQALLGVKISFIACGSYHTAAITEAGDVMVWGSNQEAQLGLGDEAESFVLTPTTLPGLSRVVGLACGTGLTAALGADGTVWAFGRLLHDVISTPRVMISPDSRVNQIACGDRYMAAWRGPLSASLAALRQAADPSTSLALRALLDGDGDDNNDLCSDLVLRLGDGRGLRAHRIVLAMRSDKLKDLLLASDHDDDGQPFELHLPPRVSAEAARAWLRYLYCDELPPLPPREDKDEDEDDGGLVGQLLELARLYGTRPLEERLRGPGRARGAQEHVSHTLAADLARAFELPLFSDLTFVLTSPSSSVSGDEETTAAMTAATTTEIVAHKCLLAARSEYFRAMFLTGLKESASRRVPIALADGVRPEAFRQLVRYLYTGHVLDDDDEDGDDDELAVELFVVGNAFGVEALVRPCARRIERGLDMKANLRELWEMAKSFGSEQLQQLCISFVLAALRQAHPQVPREVKRLPRDLFVAVVARLIASSSDASHGIKCGSCQVVVVHPSERAKCTKCVVCGWLLCRRGGQACFGRGASVPLSRAVPELLELLQGKGHRSRKHQYDVCLRCQQLLVLEQQHQEEEEEGEEGEEEDD